VGDAMKQGLGRRESARTRGVMLIYLKHLGYAADTVADGMEALDAVRTGIYGLLLLDCVMPRLEGIETAQAVRAMDLPRGQPGIVAFSAQASPEARAKCLAAGMDAFLAKPFTEAELREALETSRGGRVPGRPGGTAAEAAGSGAEAPAGQPSRIILVDDDASVRQFAWEALTTSGYEVVQLASGEDARWLLDGEPRPYELVILDVVMPGMSGPDFARWLKEKHPATRVLYITGYPEDTARQFGLPLGGFELLRKPFGAEALLRRVEDILGTGASPGSSGARGRI
jgi:DNA-binding response OmpR family regulator